MEFNHLIEDFDMKVRGRISTMRDDSFDDYIMNTKLSDIDIASISYDLPDEATFGDDDVFKFAVTAMDDTLVNKVEGDGSEDDYDNDDDGQMSSGKSCSSIHQDYEEYEVAIDSEEDDEAELPRIQAELDKLNYANESINNLEVELEESQKEYVELCIECDSKLKNLEKKLGDCVRKSRSYYDALARLEESQQHYFSARNSFERAQALYLAAKEMQMYAEDNLEFYSSDELKPRKMNRESFVDLLENAKMKVKESSYEKQRCDVAQIGAQKMYEEHCLIVQTLKKSLHRHINKSKEYFDFQASLKREIKFHAIKVEGLTSCLKEAKAVYQQSLNNLEIIGTEIQTRRDNASLKSTNSSRRNTQSIPAINTATSSSSTSSCSINDCGVDAINLTSHFNMDENSTKSIHLSVDNSKNCRYNAQSLKCRPQFRASIVL